MCAAKFESAFRPQVVTQPEQRDANGPVGAGGMVSGRSSASDNLRSGAACLRRIAISTEKLCKEQSGRFSRGRGGTLKFMQPKFSLFIASKFNQALNFELPKLNESFIVVHEAS
jgi:hypothetical protein